jgi:hypothetical protein
MILTCSAAAGQQGVNRSRRFGPDACGPVDPNYIRIANETGGQPMFLQPSEAAKAVQFMRESVGVNRVTFLWATGTIDSTPREYKVPIESTVQRATFSLSTDTKGTSMTVLLPSGENVANGTGIELTELNCGRIVTVDKPQAGDWQVTIRGSGTFWLEARGKSEIFLSTVEFVRPGGRPGHEGLFRIPGQPISGESATLELNISGPLESVVFELVTQNGELIKPVDMRVESSEGDEREYVGTFDLPVKPFRIAVTGRESGGKRYQRYFHTLFHAETVEVVPQHTADDLKPGETSTVNYTVRNVGPPATFRIVAMDPRRFVTRVEPRTLTLATGASGKISVDLTVPADTQIGVGLDLTVTATSTSDAATTNGASEHLAVFAPRNP